MKSSVYALAFLLALSSALAIQCGDILNQSVNLSSSLSCGSDAIFINATNAVLDCQGYEIRGYLNSTGIRVWTPGAFITNCVITNFSTAVALSEPTNATLIANTFAGNTYGVSVNPGLGGSYALLIDSNAFIGGIGIQSSTAHPSYTTQAVTITGNLFRSLVTGVRLVDGHANLLIGGNTFVNFSSTGVHLGESTTDTIITNNTFNASSLAGAGLEMGGSNSRYNNATRNTFIGLGIDSYWGYTPRTFCDGVGNLYLQGAGVQRPAGDCGPFPNVTLFYLNASSTLTPQFLTGSGPLSFPNLTDIVANMNSNVTQKILVTASSVQGTAHLYNSPHKEFDCQGNALSFAGRDGLRVYNSPNFTVRNCTFTNASSALIIEANELSTPVMATVINTTFSRSTYGLTINGGPWLFPNYLLASNTFKDVGYGISGSKGQRVNVTGNIFESTGRAVNLEAQNAYWLIKENRFINFSTAGVQFNDNGNENSVVLNNTFNSSASEGIAVTLGGSNNRYLNVTRNVLIGKGIDRYWGYTTHSLCDGVGNLYVGDAVSQKAFGDCGPVPNVRTFTVNASSTNTLLFDDAVTELTLPALRDVAASLNPNLSQKILIATSGYQNISYIYYAWNKELDCRGNTLSFGTREGIRVYDSPNFTLRNCTLTNASTALIVEMGPFSRPIQATFVNNTFSKSTTGLYLSGGQWNLPNFIVDSNSFVDTRYALDADKAQRVNVTRNVFRNSGAGIRFYAQDRLWYVAGNQFLNFTDAGIDFQDTDNYYNIVFNNTFNASPVASSGIDLVGSRVTSNNITGNTLIGKGIDASINYINTYCIGFGNLYLDGANSQRAPGDCGPSPSAALVRVTNVTSGLFDANATVVNVSSLPLAAAVLTGRGQVVELTRNATESVSFDQGVSSVFDCKGFTLRQNGNPTGITVASAVSNLTIRNCILREWYEAMRVSGSLVRLENNSVLNSNLSGVNLLGSAASLTDNFVCFTSGANGIDIRNQGVLTSGTGNSCDTASNYNDTGAVKCSFACPLGNFSIISSNPSAAQQGKVSSFKLQVSGGLEPYNWSLLSGAFPTGMSLQNDTIRGNATELGTFNFTVRVKESGHNRTANKSFTWEIYAPTFTAATVVVQKSAVAPIVPGRTVPFYILITNKGDIPLYNITNIEIINPSEFSIVNTTSLAVIDRNLSVHTITWKIPEISPKSSYLLQYEVEVNRDLVHGDKVRGPDCVLPRELEAQIKSCLGRFLGLQEAATQVLGGKGWLRQPFQGLDSGNFCSNRDGTFGGHRGNDVCGRIGDSVYPLYTGKVIAVKTDSNANKNFVWIESDYPDGSGRKFVTMYTHVKPESGIKFGDTLNGVDSPSGPAKLGELISLASEGESGAKGCQFPAENPDPFRNTHVDIKMFWSSHPAMEGLSGNKLRDKAIELGLFFDGDAFPRGNELKGNSCSGYKDALSYGKERSSNVQNEIVTCLSQPVEINPFTLPSTIDCALQELSTQRPKDPNEKTSIAPKFIRRDTELTYAIHYENIGDTDAKDIFLRDYLNLSFYNLSTFKELKANATLNLTTGFLRYNLYNIWLAPNKTDNVLFSIKPLANLTNGTNITNFAEIQFEIFENITTNITYNVIDETVPSCAITPLPAISKRLIFNLTMDYNDQIGEPEGFYVYSSVNGSSFKLLMFSRTNITEFRGEEDGNYSFYCVAKDTAGNQELQTAPFEARTKVGNKVPLFSPLDSFSVYENQTLTFALNVTDPDGDPVSVLAEVLPNGSSFLNNRFSWTPGFEDEASADSPYVSIFGISDGFAETRAYAFINVLNTNRPPVLAVEGNFTVTENSTLTLNLTSFDPDGDIVNYSLLNASKGALNGSFFTWKPTLDDAGIHAFNFIASDGNITVNLTRNVTVTNLNIAPVLQSIASQSIREPQSLTVRLSASDYDRDNLSFNFTGRLPKNHTFFNGTLTIGTNYSSQGNYTVNFTVSDGILTDTKSFTLTVNSTFVCFPVNYTASFTCAKTFTIDDVNDIEAYNDRVKDAAKKKVSYENVLIKGNVTADVFELHSPCKIEIAKNAQLRGGEYCIDAKADVKMAESQVRVSDIAFISQTKNVKPEKKFTARADTIALIGDEKVEIASSVTLNSTVSTFIFAKANKKGEVSISKDARLYTDGNLDIVANKTAKLGQKSALVAGGTLNISAPNCKFNKKASYQAMNLSGSCF